MQCNTNCNTNCNNSPKNYSTKPHKGQAGNSLQTMFAISGCFALCGFAVLLVGKLQAMLAEKVNLFPGKTANNVCGFCPRAFAVLPCVVFAVCLQAVLPVCLVGFCQTAKRKTANIVCNYGTSFPQTFLQVLLVGFLQVFQ